MRMFRADAGLPEALFWILVAVVTVVAQLLKSRKTPRPTRRLPPVPIREPGSPSDELREFLEKLQRGEVQTKEETHADQFPSPAPPPPRPTHSVPARVRPSALQIPVEKSGLEVSRHVPSGQMVSAFEVPVRVSPRQEIGREGEYRRAVRKATPRIEMLRAILRRRGALQQAVLLNELLGAPVGLRRFGSGAGFPPAYWV